MTFAKTTISAFILLVGATVVFSVNSFGKPEYTKKEKKTCVTCHTAPSSKELNEVGKYYKEHKTLEGAPASAKN